MLLQLNDLEEQKQSTKMPAFLDLTRKHCVELRFSGSLGRRSIQAPKPGQPLSQLEHQKGRSGSPVLENCSCANHFAWALCKVEWKLDFSANV